MTEIHGCEVSLRAAQGPLAEELFFLCQGPVRGQSARVQAEAIYRAICETLTRRGADFASVVSETVFLRDPGTDLVSIREARAGVLEEAGEPVPLVPATEIEQPPLREGAALEVAIQAVVPSAATASIEQLTGAKACACAECTRVSARKVTLGDEIRLYAGAIGGVGEAAYDQTLSMFGAAEELLQAAGMDFGDVVRTWIHLREMERDYAALNHARREFFGARGITPVPASTGIGGGPISRDHDLCLGFYAVKQGRPLVRTVMTSPTLNEAAEYGADFVRGMRVEESNKTSLLVSGTASIDEFGRSVHAGDFDAQVDRMLLNVAALLEGQGADYTDVVSAITYLKRPEDAERLREKLREARFDGFPNVLVGVPVCRPELLCETEVLAVRPEVAGKG